LADSISLPQPFAKPARPRLSWSGPALALIGALVLVIVLLRPGADASPLAWWIANSALRPDRVLPLIGLGAVLGLVRFPAFALGALTFAIGVALGFAYYEPLLAPLWALPKAAESNFFTAPAASLAIGLALIMPKRLRDWIAPVSALLTGLAAALAIVVTDPSIGSLSNRIAGVLIALWLAAAIALIVRAFHRPWFNTAGRILGSWLIAIALLYGGAALVPLRERAKAPEPAPGFPERNEPLELLPPNPDGSGGT
jgi:hypothetical protein